MLPFLLIIIILALAAYLIDRCRDSPDIELENRTGSADTSYLALKTQLSSLKTKRDVTIGDWDQLAVRTVSSAALPENKNELIEDIAREAVATWTKVFSQWVGTSFASPPPQSEHTAIKAFLARHGLLAHYLPKLAPHAKAISCYNMHFKSGAPDEIKGRLAGLIRGPFDDAKYVKLMTDLASASAGIDNLNPVISAKNRIAAQRECHREVKTHYSSLLGMALTGVYGLLILPANIKVKTSFTNRGVTFSITDFSYYYSEGINTTIWLEPIW